MSGSRSIVVADDPCGGYLTYPGVIFPSSRPSVVMVQTTQNGHSDNRLIGLCCSAAISLRRIQNAVDSLVCKQPATLAVDLLELVEDS